MQLHADNVTSSSDGHAAQNLQASVRDLRLARVVVLQAGEPGDVLGRDIARVAAVHAGELFELRAAPHVAEPVVGHVHRQEPGEGRESRQRRERRVVHELAAHREPLERRHVRERREAAPWRFGHSRPQMYSMVRDRLRAAKPSSVATVPCAISMRSRGIAAMCRMAVSLQSVPFAPERAKVGQIRQRPQAIGCES